MSKAIKLKHSPLRRSSPLRLRWHSRKVCRRIGVQVLVRTPVMRRPTSTPTAKAWYPAPLDTSDNSGSCLPCVSLYTSAVM
jgi:hypothetical protein